MVRLKATDAREEFSDLMNRVSYGKERIILQRHGKDLLALVPIEDLKLLEKLIAEHEDRIDLAEAQRALNDPNDEAISLEQARAELGL